jgi:Spy/CpxP family protein refolding chaperone
MKRFANPRALAAILIASFGLAAAGCLAAQNEDARRTGHRQGAPAAHAMFPQFHERVMDRLRGDLRLDEKQEALWKEARDFARAQRDAVLARLAKDRAEIKALLDQPGADLRAVERRVAELRAEGQQLRGAVRERWFAVYDSLGDEQKEKVRLFFRDGMEKMERFAGRAGEGAGDRAGRGHRRKPDRKPAAPPASAPVQ